MSAVYADFLNGDEIMPGCRQRCNAGLTVVVMLLLPPPAAARGAAQKLQGGFPFSPAGLAQCSPPCGLLKPTALICLSLDRTTMCRMCEKRCTVKHYCQLPRPVKDVFPASCSHRSQPSPY